MELGNLEEKGCQFFTKYGRNRFSFTFILIRSVSGTRVGIAFGKIKTIKELPAKGDLRMSLCQEN